MNNRIAINAIRCAPPLFRTALPKRARSRPPIMFLILFACYPILFFDNRELFYRLISLNLYLRWVLLLILCILGTFLLLSKRARWQGSKVLNSFFLFGLIALSSALWSENSLYTCLRGVTVLMLGYVYLQALPGCLKGEVQFPKVLYVLTLLLAGFIALLFATYIARAPGATYGGAWMLRGIFRSSNSVGIFTALTLPLFWVQMTITQQKRLKFFFRITFALCLICLCLSTARGSYVAALVSWFFLYYTLSPARGWRLMAIGSIFLALLVCIGQFSPLLKPLLFKDYERLKASGISELNANDTRDVSVTDMLGGRSAQLERAISAIEQSDIMIGAGFGIAAGQTQYWELGFASGGGSNWGAIAEKGNQFLGTLEELGIVGVVAYIFLCWAILRVVFRPRSIRARATRSLSVIHLGLSTAVLAGLVVVNSEAFLFSAGSQFAHLFWLEVGLLVYADRLLLLSARRV